MNTDFKTAGKTFSHVVHTQGFPVVIQTASNRIYGTLHLREKERIKDSLNLSEPFIAVTKARVYDTEGKTLLHETDFLALNRRSIDWVFEDENGDRELAND